MQQQEDENVLKGATKVFAQKYLGGVEECCGSIAGSVQVSKGCYVFRKVERRPQRRSRRSELPEPPAGNVSQGKD
jgi:hypothetical protein